MPLWFCGLDGTSELPCFHATVCDRRHVVLSFLLHILPRMVKFSHLPFLTLVPVADRANRRVVFLCIMFDSARRDHVFQSPLSAAGRITCLLQSTRQGMCHTAERQLGRAPLRSAWLARLHLSAPYSMLLWMLLKVTHGRASARAAAINGGELKDSTSRSQCIYAVSPRA